MQKKHEYLLQDYILYKFRLINLKMERALEKLKELTKETSYEPQTCEENTQNVM
jgi:hypothetical protein